MFLSENVKLRATHNFDPEQITESEETEWDAIIFRGDIVTKQMDQEQRHGDIEYDGDAYDNQDNENLVERGTSRQHEQINPEAELSKLQGKGYRRLREEISDDESQEDVIKMEKKETVIQEKGFITDLEGQQEVSLLEQRFKRRMFLRKKTLPFKRGEKMETNRSANIG